MAFSDLPPKKPDEKPDDGGMASLLRAEKLTQIAFVLPVSVFVGWILGVGLDKWLHQHWIYLVGIIFGAVAGFVQIFRLISTAEKDVK
jgi:ATP synthase protein I